MNALRTIAYEPFDDVVRSVIDALAKEGFEVLHDLDVQAMMLRRLAVCMPAHRILGVFNSHIAMRSLLADLDAAFLVPCNVTIRQEDDGAVVVTFFDPQASALAADMPEVHEIARQVRERLAGACRKLSSSRMAAAA